MKVIFFLLLFLSQLSFAQTKATKSLYSAISKNNLTLAQNALAEGADPTAVLLRATELNRAQIVKLLLAHHADVNVRDQNLGVTPLMVAAHRDLTEIAQLLLSHGAEVNAKNLYGQTALGLSAYANSFSVARLLVSNRETDVNGADGLCALAIAAGRGNAGIVLLLKKLSGAQGSSPNCLSDALTIARKKNFEHISAILSREQDFKLRPGLKMSSSAQSIF